MKIKFLLTVIISVFGILFFANRNSFKRLNQNAKISKFPKIESTYKDIFLKFDSTKLEASYTYYSNGNRFPVATYTFESNYKLVIYKLPLNISENIPINQIFSISNSKNFATATEDIIYDGSFKTNYIRFLNATNKISGVKKLNVYYSGEMTTKPIISDSTVSYSINASSLIGKYDQNNIVDFNVDNRKFFKNFSLELIICRRKNNVYMVLVLPLNNETITDHTKILNYLNDV